MSNARMMGICCRAVVAGGTTMLALACGSSDSNRDTATVVPLDTAPALVAGQETVRIMILSDTMHYDFGADSGCVAASPGALTTNRGAIPDSLTYASATLKSGAPAHAHGRIVGRLKSNAAYPSLGIAAGANYVWRDSSGGSWRVMTVPAATTAPLTWLAVTNAQFAPGTVTGFRCAVAQSVGACVGGCGTGHCGEENVERAFAPGDTASIRVHPAG